MITSTQLLILVVLGLIFLFAIVDRICRCKENVANAENASSTITSLLDSDKDNIKSAISFINGMNGNGNRPL